MNKYNSELIENHDSLHGVQITSENRDLWLADRRLRIGASEAAVAIGLPGFRSRLSLYLLKTGDLPESKHDAGIDERSRQKMLWGLRHERAIANAYQEETGCQWAMEQVYMISRTHPFMVCTIDRMTTTGKIVEFKTTGYEEAPAMGEPGTDMIPHMYLVQVLHQMFVCEASECDVAVLIGGNDFRIYHVTMKGNENLVSRIVDMEEQFMKAVRDRVPPEIDPAKDSGLMAYLFPDEQGNTQFDQDQTDLVMTYESLGDTISRLKKEREVLKVKLAEAMTTNTCARMTNGKLFMRKIISVEERIQSVSAYSYPKFWVKNPPRSKF